MGPELRNEFVNYLSKLTKYHLLGLASQGDPQTEKAMLEDDMEEIWETELTTDEKDFVANWYLEHGIDVEGESVLDADGIVRLTMDVIHWFSLELRNSFLAFDQKETIIDRRS